MVSTKFSTYDTSRLTVYVTAGNSNTFSERNVFACDKCSNICVQAISTFYQTLNFMYLIGLKRSSPVTAGNSNIEMICDFVIGQYFIKP